VLVSANAVMAGSYAYGEVARSVLIAIAASYAALDLAGRVTAAQGRVRLAWLSGGAFAMGIGIWEMHVKGMLAFHLPVPVQYHWPTALAALLVAIFASAVSLYVMSRRQMGRIEALTGSSVMGAGIAGLHYIMMAAMRLPAITRYSPLLVTCSILLAILFSLIALLMAFGLREETRWSIQRKAGSATVMGIAISAMHYTGMAAASFFPAPPPDLSQAVAVTPIGNSGVVVVTLIVLAAAVITSFVDRRASAEIQRLNQDLERRVVARTAQLEAVNQTLRKEIAERERAEMALQETQRELAHVTRVLAMGELVASIAHEINQPLTGIVTNANFCLRQLAGSTSPDLDQLREAIGEVVNDGTRVSEVISRIRALLKKDASARVELDINEIVKEALVLVRSEVTRSRVSLRADLAPDLPRVSGDRVQLQQVVINLIMNAIDAMRTVTDRQRKLIIKSAMHPEGVLVQVQDSGTGLSPEFVDRIFEPFFTTKPEGVGMGLSISRSIIDAHAGHLWVTPGSEYGAIFQFTVPMADTPDERDA
jgi:two-component system sensor histidine kinase/response regulator